MKALKDDGANEMRSRYGIDQMEPVMRLTIKLESLKNGETLTLTRGDALVEDLIKQWGLRAIWDKAFGY